MAEENHHRCDLFHHKKDDNDKPLDSSNSDIAYGCDKPSSSYSSNNPFNGHSYTDSSYNKTSYFADQPSSGYKSGGSYGGTKGWYGETEKVRGYGSGAGGYSDSTIGKGCGESKKVGGGGGTGGYSDKTSVGEYNWLISVIPLNSIT